MVRTQIYLTEQEKRALEALAKRTGKSRSALIREAIDAMIQDPSLADRQALLSAGRGLWRDRTDLPDFAGLRREIDRGSNLGAFRAVAVDSDVARAGGRYRAEHGPTHGTGLADALIAASAGAASARLVTRNRKHFPMVEDLFTPY